MRIFYIISRLIYLLPILYCFSSQAQTRTDRDTSLIAKITDWISIYELSNPTFAESEKSGFKSSTYCNAYMIGLLADSSWSSKKLNTVSKLRQTQKKEPYVLFELHIKKSATGTEINPVISSSFSTDTDELEQSFQRELKENYVSSLDAYPDIREGLTACFDILKGTLRNSLAPALSIRIYGTDEVFMEGEEIKITDGFSREMQIEVLNRDGMVIPPADVLWKNADIYEKRAIVSFNESEREKIVTAKTDQNEIAVKVSISQTGENIDDILHNLLIEVLENEKLKALKKIDDFKSDSINYHKAVSEIKERLDKENISLIDNPSFQGMGIYSLYAEPVKVSAIEEAKLYEILDLKKGATTIEQYLLTYNKLRIEFNRVAFADLMINNPDHIAALLSDLKSSSGQLLARLLLRKDRSGNKEKARNIIVQFLNTKIQNYSYKG